MERVNIRQRVGALALVGLLVGAGSALAQQTAVSGRVTDSTSRQPIVAAQVFVGGTTLRTLTDQQGRFHFDNVPPGAVTVRVAFIGYKAQVKTVTAQPGAPATVDFALLFAPIGLDAVVVTATGPQMQREQGNAIHTVDAAAVVSKAPVTNMADMLNSRAPGMVVQEAGGTTGSGTRTRIRGSNSLSLSNEPVLYVDGIRVENGASSSSIGVGGQVPSRLNDLNPNDVEAVEVAGGPSAGALFGTDAANGVISFRTRQGKPGPTRWEAYASGGTITDNYTYPTNYRGIDLDSTWLATHANNPTCTLVTTVRPVSPCTQDSVRQFNPLETNSPFRNGSRQEYGLSASGGTEQTTYYVSSHYSNELGVYPINTNRQISVLANLHQQASAKVDFSAHAAYTSGKLRLPQNDNNSFGVLSSGYLGRADTINSGFGFLLPSQSFTVRTFQTIDRFTGSGQVNYRPAEWLTMHGVAGVDFTSRYDENSILPGNIPASFSSNANAGSRNANPFQLYNWTTNFDATAAFVLTPQIKSQTTVGLQYFKNVLHGVTASTQTLTAGTNSLAGGVLPTVSEQTAPVVTLGRYAEERLAYNDRVYITGAVRDDKNTAFGVKFGSILYPKVAGSWVISEEPFFPKTAKLSTLRLRAAWGESGVRPGVTDALQFFNGAPWLVGATDIPGITIASLGNPNLKPETTHETELGFEADVLSEAVHLDFAYYNKASRDALIARTLAPSLGGPTTRFENLGRVSNKGVEISSSWRALTTHEVSVNVTATAWGNRNRLVELGTGISPIIFGLGGASQRFQRGFALGSYFMVPYTFSDANADGIIDTSEVKLGSAPVFLGQPFPDHGGTLALDVTLRAHLRLYALLDGRFGNKLFNSTEQFRCGLANCRGINDKTAPLADQAAAAGNLKGTQAGYIEDGSFTKLREVSITYFAPDAWAQRFGARELSFSIAGRNLATWTKYKGIDPELNEAGQSNFITADFLTQPPVRYFIGRVNVTF
jgi:TonB-linked SusC/RagA family outer membrane protein